MKTSSKLLQVVQLPHLPRWRLQPSHPHLPQRRAEPGAAIAATARAVAEQVAELDVHPGGRNPNASKVVALVGKRWKKMEKIASRAGCLRGNPIRQDFLAKNHPNDNSHNGSLPNL